MLQQQQQIRLLSPAVPVLLLALLLLPVQRGDPVCRLPQQLYIPGLVLCSFCKTWPPVARVLQQVRCLTHHEVLDSRRQQQA